MLPVWSETSFYGKKHVSDVKLIVFTLIYILKRHLVYKSTK